MKSNPQSGENGCCEKCTDSSISGIWCNDERCPCHSLSQDKLPSPSQEEWEDIFDLAFGDFAGWDATAPEVIKDFIRQTLSQARASTLKEVGEAVAAMQKTGELCECDFARNDAFHEVLALLQEKRDSKGGKV